MTDALIGPLLPPDVHVMTFNIRRRIDMTPRRADRWTTRIPAVRTLLNTECPTLLGTQEVMPDQASVLHDALGERYGVVGHGRRADGRGEGCPLYYDGERLELLDWEQSALSDRPGVPGSTSWGNIVPRIMVIATFRDRSTHARFIAINTHLDHLSRRSRQRSVEAIRHRVLDASLPTIVTGDLNAGQESLAVQALFDADVLQDAWAVADKRVTPRWGTFPNYRDPEAGEKRIDWIGVTPTVEVVRAGINDRRFGGRWPSDHLPVQAVVRLRPCPAEPTPTPTNRGADA